MSSEHSEVVAESGDYRARIILDEGPEEPYNDGGTPILRKSPRRDERDGEQITGISSYTVHPSIIDAWWQWSYSRQDMETFERYLRIFHGTRTIEWYTPHDSDYIYITFDTADWRKKMGLTDEYLAGHPDVTLANMDEWRSYCEGDVWGVVVERRVTWVPKDVDHDPDVEMQTWEEVQDTAVWGHYGTDWAKQAAREALQSVTNEETP